MNMGLFEFSFSSMLLHFLAETPPGDVLEGYIDCILGIKRVLILKARY